MHGSFTPHELPWVASAGARVEEVELLHTSSKYRIKELCNNRNLVIERSLGQRLKVLLLSPGSPFGLADVAVADHVTCNGFKRYASVPGYRT